MTSIGPHGGPYFFSIPALSPSHVRATPPDPLLVRLRPREVVPTAEMTEVGSESGIDHIDYPGS